MQCSECRELVGAYADRQLMPDEQESVRGHLETCAQCGAALRLVEQVSTRIREGLVRHEAPDVLKARIRSALQHPDALDAVVAARQPWWRYAAAAALIAAASSVLTVVALRGDRDSPVGSEVVASHIRSLMPGHLTDVASTNQHNVKPWFNGRVDVSPTVINLDSADFPLVGGRLDYVDGRAVPVVVYARRQHIINVYSWPSASRSALAPRVESDHGYTTVHWRSNGIESWAVSDLNRAELNQLVARLRE